MIAFKSNAGRLIIITAGHNTISGNEYTAKKIHFIPYSTKDGISKFEERPEYEVEGYRTYPLYRIN